MTGADIRALRARAGLRQVDLAPLLGISANHLARVERGVSAVTDQMAALVTYLARDRRALAAARIAADIIQPVPQP